MFLLYFFLFLFYLIAAEVALRCGGIPDQLLLLLRLNPPWLWLCQAQSSRDGVQSASSPPAWDFLARSRGVHAGLELGGHAFRRTTKGKTIRKSLLHSDISVMQVVWFHKLPGGNHPHQGPTKRGRGSRGCPRPNNKNAEQNKTHARPDKPSTAPYPRVR